MLGKHRLSVVVLYCTVYNRLLRASHCLLARCHPGQARLDLDLEYYFVGRIVRLLENNWRSHDTSPA